MHLCFVQLPLLSFQRSALSPLLLLLSSRLLQTCIHRLRTPAPAGRALSHGAGSRCSPHPASFICFLPLDCQASPLSPSSPLLSRRQSRAFVQVRLAPTPSLAFGRGQRCASGHHLAWPVELPPLDVLERTARLCALPGALCQHIGACRVLPALSRRRPTLRPALTLRRLTLCPPTALSPLLAPTILSPLVPSAIRSLRRSLITSSSPSRSSPTSRSFSSLASSVAMPHRTALPRAPILPGGPEPANLGTLPLLIERALARLRSISDPLCQYTYLAALRSRSPDVFYGLVGGNMKECTVRRVSLSSEASRGEREGWGRTAEIVDGRRGPLSAERLARSGPARTRADCSLNRFRLQVCQNGSARSAGAGRAVPSRPRSVARLVSRPPPHPSPQWSQCSSE